MATILTLAAVGRIVLAVFLYKDGNNVVANLGWAILWISAIFGCLPIFTEETSIEKFGEAYKEYMQRVPRVNFLFGISRLIEQKLFFSS